MKSKKINICKSPVSSTKKYFRSSLKLGVSKKDRRRIANTLQQINCKDYYDWRAEDYDYLDIDEMLSNIDTCKETFSTSMNDIYNCDLIENKKFLHIVIFGSRNLPGRLREAKRISKVLGIIHNKLRLTPKSYSVSINKGDSNGIKIKLNKFFWEYNVAGHFILTAIRYALNNPFNCRNINSWKSLNEYVKSDDGCRDSDHWRWGKIAISDIVNKRKRFRDFHDSYVVECGITDYSDQIMYY